MRCFRRIFTTATRSHRTAAFSIEALNEFSASNLHMRDTIAYHDGYAYFAEATSLPREMLT